jgi:hypothetical protein
MATDSPQQMLDASHDGFERVKRDVWDRNPLAERRQFVLGEDHVRARGCMSIRESITDKYAQDTVGIERRHRGRFAGRAKMSAWLEWMREFSTPPQTIRSQAARHNLRAPRKWALAGSAEDSLDAVVESIADDVNW